MDFSQIIEGVKQVGFPVAFVVYLLYLLQTDLKELTERIIELDTYVKTKLGGGGN